MTNLSGEIGKQYMLKTIAAFGQNILANPMLDFDFDLYVYDNYWKLHQNPTPSKLIDVLPDLSLKCAITTIHTGPKGMEIGICPSDDFSTNIDADVIDALVGVAKILEEKAAREKAKKMANASNNDPFDSPF